MSDRTYLFVDGEYLRQKHRQAMLDFFGVEGDLDLETLLRKVGASRGYFYDSIDDSARHGEDEATVRARTAPQEGFLARVRALPGFHVRLGTVSQGKKRQQKEVDILLAVDMLTHGFNGSMQRAVLLTGDLDFRPVVEALVRNGVFVHVWYDSSAIAKELPGAADFGYEISFRDFHSWNSEEFRNTHPIPSEYEHAGSPAGELAKVGTVAGYPAELRSLQGVRSDALYNLWITISPGDTIRVLAGNVELLERYVEIQYGPIVWEANAGEIIVTGEDR
jgi:uncharacterized LabA/DUF88 family protein